MSNPLQILALAALFFITSALKLPSYIKNPCRRNDPNLDECVVKQGTAAIPNFLHGDPKYKVPNLDPLDIQELVLRQGTKQVGLNLALKNCKLYGLGHADFTAARTDLKKRHIEWDFVNKVGLQVLGDYNISGQVLVLPIVGAGKANITFGSLVSTYSYDFEVVKKSNGKEYMNVTTGEFSFNPSIATFKLDNLFNGDKLLGDNMNQFLNENWKELMKEFGPAMGVALGEVFRQLLRSILGLVPYDLVYPDS